MPLSIRNHTKEFYHLMKHIEKKTQGQAHVYDYNTENIDTFVIEIHPKRGYYQKGKFLFQLTLGKRYPREPPEVICLSDIYHPNIDTDNVDSHNICLNLFDEWNSSFGLEDIVQGLLFLFYHPNLTDPISSLFSSDLTEEQFEINVAKFLRGESVDGYAFAKNPGYEEIDDMDATTLHNDISKNSWRVGSTPERNQPSVGESEKEEAVPVAQDTLMPISGDTTTDTSDDIEQDIFIMDMGDAAMPGIINKEELAIFREQEVVIADESPDLFLEADEDEELELSASEDLMCRNVVRSRYVRHLSSGDNSSASSYSTDAVYSGAEDDELNEMVTAASNSSIDDYSQPSFLFHMRERAYYHPRMWHISLPTVDLTQPKDTDMCYLVVPFHRTTFDAIFHPHPILSLQPVRRIDQNNFPYLTESLNTFDPIWRVREHKGFLTRAAVSLFRFTAFGLAVLRRRRSESAPLRTLDWRELLAQSTILYLAFVGVSAGIIHCIKIKIGETKVRLCRRRVLNGCSIMFNENVVRML